LGLTVVALVVEAVGDVAGGEVVVVEALVAAVVGVALVDDVPVELALVGETAVGRGLVGAVPGSAVCPHEAVTMTARVRTAAGRSGRRIHRP
jgi:hypothetical protein